MEENFWLGRRDLTMSDPILFQQFVGFVLAIVSGIAVAIFAIWWSTRAQTKKDERLQDKKIADLKERLHVELVESFDRLSKDQKPVRLSNAIWNAAMNSGSLELLVNDDLKVLADVYTQIEAYNAPMGRMDPIIWVPLHRAILLARDKISWLTRIGRG